LATVHIASLPNRIDETKNMWPHMNSARTRPLALCAQSSRAGQRLLCAARLTPPGAIGTLPSMQDVSNAG
jgi:hypothetical protein